MRAVGLAAAVVAADFAWQFPANANHQYLQLVCLALLLLLRDEVDAEVGMLAAALRTLLIAGLVYAGLQKAAWGYYFQGELLAYAVAQFPRFADVLQIALPADELARLSRLVVQEGTGPFRVDSALFLVVSNAAWLAELALPLLLVSRRLRRLGVVATLVYFLAIEAAAREVFFGGMMAGVALLFGPPSWLPRALPVFGVALVILLATSLGLLPRWFFS